MRKTLPFAVGFLVLLGLVSVGAHFDDEAYNPGFFEYPGITRSHVFLGAFYLVFAPLQFVGRIRERSLGYHRMAGRLLVTGGLGVGASALFLGLVVPFSGWAERIVIGFFGTFFLFSLLRGFVHIRAGRVELHREWMMRALNVGLAIASMRLMFVPALLYFGDAHATTLSILAFTIAFVLHGAFAEFWIRRTRGAEAVVPGGAPSLVVS